MVTAIGSAAIQEMLAQIRSTVDQAKSPQSIAPNSPSQGVGGTSPARADFSEALKAHLSDISKMEKIALQMEEYKWL